MGKWVPDSYLDLILDQIKLSDAESICSAQPTTYFEAVKGDLYTLSTAYDIGDVVRPPTSNNFVYECLVAGTSGGSEPGWGSSQDQEFADNDITWKTHINYCLASTSINPANITIEDGDIDGRMITVPEVIGVITHETGEVTHMALTKSTGKVLSLATSATTTITEDNNVESGRTTIFFSFKVFMRDPV